MFFKKETVHERATINSYYKCHNKNISIELREKLEEIPQYFSSFNVHKNYLGILLMKILIQ